MKEKKEIRKTLKSSLVRTVLSFGFCLSGCGEILKPADGINNLGGAFNHCKEECRREAAFRESIRQYNAEKLMEIVKKGGSIAYIPCSSCYPCVANH